MQDAVHSKITVALASTLFMIGAAVVDDRVWGRTFTNEIRAPMMAFSGAILALTGVLFREPFTQPDTARYEEWMYRGVDALALVAMLIAGSYCLSHAT